MGKLTGKARDMRRMATGLALIAALGAASCTTQFRNHGFAPSDADLSQVQVGVDTRETVATRIGTPTTGGVQNGTGFYYVESRFRLFAFQAPREIEREVVAVTFDGAGVVDNIERFGLEQGRVVSLSRRVTQDNVRDTTFIRQLFGSIGQFNAGDFLGDE